MNPTERPMLLPEVTSQNQTHALRDPPHATSVFPSGLNVTTDAPQPPSPSKAPVFLPVATSHSWMARLVPPKASVLPSGLNAIGGIPSASPFWAAFSFGV